MVRYENVGDRPRRRRNSITRDDVIAAARAMVETQGISGLTIRAVAASMGAAPMSLYTHVATKDELLDAVLDDVMGEFDTGVDPAAPWTTQLEQFALALAEHLDSHQWAILPLMSRPDPGERTTAVGEVALSAALLGGLDASRAVTAFGGILSLVYGRAAFLYAAQLPVAQQPAEIANRIASAGAERYPATAAVAAELTGYAAPVHLERAVRALVAGLAL